MKLLSMAVLSLAMFLDGNSDGCDQPSTTAKSGVQQVQTQVATGSDGMTVEQRNVRDRLAMDNKPGSIKHLYVISAYSGQTILYSTVKGKVTSSGKRLSRMLEGGGYADHPYVVDAIQDDGTFGSSVEYIYWWDVQGRYHQLYVSGGTLVTLSDQPLPIKSVIINIEGVKPE